MSYLPLYIDTSGKKCLIIGGGKVASRKLVPILKSKMHVTMISPEIHNEILEFVKDKGPVLEGFNFKNFLNNDNISFTQKLHPIYKAIQKTREKLDKKNPSLKKTEGFFSYSLINWEHFKL